MSSPAIVTVVRMMETLPEAAQDQIADHLREYLEELQDELRWQELIEQTQPQLIAAARKAKAEIAAGLAQPLNLDQL